MNQQFWGKFPAIVTAYDPATRLCRVKIPAIAENADVDPEAEIAYPLGDKPKIKDGVVTTEIEILVGDDVWVEFLNGDQNHPIIVNFRCPKVGNDVGWRRWHHANVQVIADGEMILNATKLTINATDVVINSTTLVNNGVSISDKHKHKDVQAGGGTSGVPI